MTVSAGVRSVPYTGNDATTSFAVTYPFFELLVSVDNVVKTNGVDYTITGGNGNTGSVEFMVAPVGGAEIVIDGNETISQGLDLVLNDPFPPDAVERAFDRLTMIAGNLKTVSETTQSAAMSAEEAAASAAEAVEAADSADTDASTASAAASTATTKAAEAATSADNADTDASTASAAASTATTKAAEAATSADNADTDASTASAAASTATTKAANASTSETNAAASAAAAASSETNAAASESAASTAKTAAEAAQAAAEQARDEAQDAAAGGVTASAVTFTPAGTIAATNVQAAVEEVSGDVDALTEDVGDNTADIAAVTASKVMRINRVVITSSQTYTPSAGLLFAKVEAQAPGGGSGGADGTGSGGSAGVASGAGSAGENREGVFSAADIGASQAVTIGAPGSAGSNTGGDGGDASDVVFGTLMTAKGGKGGKGTGSNSSSSVPRRSGVNSTSGSGGDIATPGGDGVDSVTNLITPDAGTVDIPITTSIGGQSRRGMPRTNSNASVYASSTANAIAGNNYGAGASGGYVHSTTGITGAAGGAGVLIIEEYLNA